MSKVLFLASFVALALALPCLASAAPQSPGGELQAAIARAGELRGKAGDFMAEAYFPGEWIVAEALYAEAGRINAGGAGDAAAAFDMAANSFASILRLTIPLYAQAREDEIMMVRDGLVAAGARASFPELMGLADRAALAALDLYEAGDYYSARDSAAEAYAMFQILETTFGAWQTRREIIRRGFIDYARDNYERAEAVIGDAVQAYLAGEFPAAMENAIEAQARYFLVLTAGWAAVAERSFSMARAERYAAVEARANVAARVVFEEADLFYETATDSIRMEYYREAAELFAEAAVLYAYARVSTLERRRLAAEAIMEANRRIEERIRAARGAGQISEE
ncbi:MAG: hypothetical protein FWB79_04750 [Treponema sp.]|nr:hypothetical protein [Treponema sp.]